MIKLKNLLNEAKKFGESITFSEKGIPFENGITPALKKEAEDYLKSVLKTNYGNDWKFKKWSGKDDPRIIKKGTRDAYLFGFAETEAKSPILKKNYTLEFDITWKPNMKEPTVAWTIDKLSNDLDENDIAPAVKKWFMDIQPKDMPKKIKPTSVDDVPSSFYKPFEGDVVLTYYCGGVVDDDEGPYRVLEVFEVCWKLYYEEWKKQYPNIFQKALSKIKGIFEDEQSSKLKDILNEGILPLKKDKFYFDKRKNQTLRIFSVDGNKVRVQYFDFKTRKPNGKTDTYPKDQAEYLIKQGAWDEWKQPFLKEASKEPYVVYHNTYSSAVQAAEKYAEGRGYTVDTDDWANQIAFGPKKPSSGKTNRAQIGLIKNGKLQRKALQIQVYNRGTNSNPYELNAYIN